MRALNAFRSIPWQRSFVCRERPASNPLLIENSTSLSVAGIPEDIFPGLNCFRAKTSVSAFSRIRRLPPQDRTPMRSKRGVELD